MVAERTDMTKAFTKGDLVTYLSDWDRKGTVIFRHAVVYACGKKQMVLTDAETGEEMGRHFRPEKAVPREHGDFPAVYACGNWTFPRLTDEEAEAKALEIGAEILDEKRAHLERILSREDNHPAYAASIRESLEDLHEPRGARYWDIFPGAIRR